MSYHQITMDEWLFGEEDPLRMVARKASPETRGDRLNVWACLMGSPTLNSRDVDYIRKAYVPYGYAGHYGDDIDYSMSPRGIRVIYKRKETIYSWRQFAEVLRDLCRCGEYDTKEER